MAPIKFEEHIKDRLEKRTLKPNPKSWDALSKKLDEHESKKSNKLFWYVGIAASIIGILFVANSLLFNTPVKIDENLPQVVDGEKIPFDNEKLDTKLVETPVLEDHPEHSNNHESANELTSDSKKVSKNTTQRQNRIKADAKTNNLAQNQNSQHVLNTAFDFEQIGVEKTDNTFELVQESVANSTEKVVVNQSDLDSEIEKLLNEAQTTLTATNNTKTIDANTLLQDVENDLDQSFKNKVFEALKTNFKKVKTAVADRNN
ncbi:hypothetical protein [Hanstruepera ponticola]|uniref:hypothetical protein n=1 Tax=Hanstruepera ponticola TaxID=2042995 RepID=UPI000CF0DE54|nr:hypothetical protein [Hanstruepera ponticola]